jgi:ABC-2 type transport system ATP-binding protein
MSPVIVTRDLRKTYGDGKVVAVDGIDLDVGAGEIFGLLGPNGAGKTTTIGMLTTSVIPTGGTATIAGVDVVAQPTVAKQLIGVVPQFNTLDRALTVGENLYFHGRYFGMGRTEARAARDESLERFGLGDRAGAAVMTLSGGMAQRLMVARATLHRPAVLFLDEPTSGLDPQSRLALWDVVRGLRSAGQTVLLTTHYMEEADQLCDRVAIMDHGRIVALDSPAGLKRSVAEGTVVRVSVAGDGSDDARDEQLARAGVALAAHLPDCPPGTVVDGALQLTVPSTTGVLPKVMAAAVAAGLVVTDLSASEPTLETVFIALTGRSLREGPPSGPPVAMGRPR